MKSLVYEQTNFIRFLVFIFDSIRGLGQIAEMPIIWLNPVDALWGKGFRVFSSRLLQ